MRLSLNEFVASLSEVVATEDGSWTIKGFIDAYKNIYTISADTKIISKILEIHLFPQIMEFAQRFGYKVVLADKQNWYPDLTFVCEENESIKFAVDIKTTFRRNGKTAGFTLGSHGSYFKERNKMIDPKNPSEYITEFLNFLSSIESSYKFCLAEMKKQEQLTQDYLHSLELDNLKYEERNKVATKLATNRKDRRYFKDRVEEYEPIIKFLNEQKNKNVVNQLKQVLGVCRKAVAYHKDRFYIPKVLKEKE